MSISFGVWVFVLAVCFGPFVIVMLIEHHLRAKRRQAMSRVAQEQGFSFKAGRQYLVKTHDLPVAAWLRLWLFNEWGQISNMMKGNISGTEVMLFDYRSGTGDYGVSDQTVAAFCLRESTLPFFALRPIFLNVAIVRKGLRFLQRCTMPKGPQSIVFGMDPEFSRRYELVAREGAVQQLFNEEIRRYFTGQPEELYVEGGGNWLIVYKAARVTGLTSSLTPMMTDPDEVRRFWEKAVRIFQRFSRHP